MLSIFISIIGDSKQHRRCHRTKSGSFHHGGLTVIDGQQHAAVASKVQGSICRNSHSCGCLSVRFVPFPLRNNGVLLATFGIGEVTNPSDFSSRNTPVCTGNSQHLDHQHITLSDINGQLQTVVVNAVSDQGFLCIGIHVGNNDVTGHAFSNVADIQQNRTVCRSGVGVVVAVVIACFQSNIRPAQLLQNLRVHLRACRMGNLQYNFLHCLSIICNSKGAGCHHAGTAHQNSITAVNTQQHASNTVCSVVCSANRDIRQSCGRLGLCIVPHPLRVDDDGVVLAAQGGLLGTGQGDLSSGRICLADLDDNLGAGSNIQGYCAVSTDSSVFTLGQGNNRLSTLGSGDLEGHHAVFLRCPAVAGAIGTILQAHFDIGNIGDDLGRADKIVKINIGVCSICGRCHGNHHSQNHKQGKHALHWYVLLKIYLA